MFVSFRAKRWASPHRETPVELSIYFHREISWGHLHLPTFVGGQDGSIGIDSATGVAMAEDGSVICVGYTYGSWDGLLNGERDFAAFRLDGNGEEIWRYQVGFSEHRVLVDCVCEDRCLPLICNAPMTGRLFF